MHDMPLFPQQTKLNGLLLHYTNATLTTNCCVVLLCGSNSLTVFKIQVLIQQTTLGMSDHMILSALITCSIVK